MSTTKSGGGGEAAARQRVRALAKANEVRSARAAIRRRLKRGEIGIAEAFDSAPGSTPVFELLAALPGGAKPVRGNGTGVTKARALAAAAMERAGASVTATVDELTEEDRALVVRALPDRVRPTQFEPLGPGEGAAGKDAADRARGLREGLSASEPEEAEELLRELVIAVRFYADGGEGPEQARAALRALGARAGVRADDPEGG